MGCSARTPTGVGGSGVIAASDLVDGVRQQGLQDGEAVPHPAGGTRQVDDQCAPGDSGQATGERRGRHLLAAERADGLGGSALF